jgi:hypothetical protein
MRGRLVTALLGAAIWLIGCSSFQAAAAVRPVPDSVARAVARKAGSRNFMPTRMLIGYRLAGWSIRDGILRMRFRNNAGRTVNWTVAPTKGVCRAGMQKSFQLAGNKVWWAQGGGNQRAWRCVVGPGGRPLRLTAWSVTPPRRLADVGLGSVVASGKRY